MREMTSSAQRGQDARLKASRRGRDGRRGRHVPPDIVRRRVHIRLLMESVSQAER
jgi:hypothetical protein